MMSVQHVSMHTRPRRKGSPVRTDIVVIEWHEGSPIYPIPHTTPLPLASIPYTEQRMHPMIMARAQLIVHWQYSLGPPIYVRLCASNPGLGS